MSEIYIISYPSLVPNLFCRVEKTGLKHPLEYVVNCLQTMVSGIFAFKFQPLFQEHYETEGKNGWGR